MVGPRPFAPRATAGAAETDEASPVTPARRRVRTDHAAETVYYLTILLLDLCVGMCRINIMPKFTITNGRLNGCFA